MLSIFDIYKIGVGPSSSHTNGPMIAGHQFIEKNAASLSSIKRIQVDLYGSLSLTGKGHHTDRASILGLLGNTPESIDIAAANEQLQQCIKSKTLILNNAYQIEFDIENDVVFNKESLPLHENAMTISAYDSDGRLIDNESYFSIGGGFIATEKQLKSAENHQTIEVELPFTSADELLLRAQENGLSIGSLVLRNELAFRSAADTQKKADKIWTIMSHCIERGLTTEGILDGGLHLTRRAPALLKHLEANQSLGVDPMEIMDWVNLFAFAVSEENAAGGQIITSPTNGASGVIPAVLNYYHTFIRPLKSKQIEDFIAVSGAIGMLYKMNASISGAEVGCQGEIGVSSSMAAAGLTALRGGSNEQVCMAAEIAMEHSLGMTCDPIAGLVQVPCIERNAMGAMKAINASRMALKRTSKCLISLDKVIETMFKTGKDMNKKYRETSLGGLALIHLAPPCE